MKSLLEKPLNLLTEDDITQITREECRQFLKDRGMRRPSWNKSQAIQQVISLKALLEDRSDPDDPSSAVKIRPKPRSVTPPRISQTSPYRRKDVVPPCLIPAAGKSQLVKQSLLLPPRDFAGGDLGQLTIFYGGKVNVYDGVPSVKARDIMQLAADPNSYDPKTVAQVSSGPPFVNRFGPANAGPSPAVHSCANAPSGKLQRSCKDSIDEGRASREPVSECPTSRKASLKRYLDKRKDRYKGRRIVEGSSSSSMELMYLSQKFSGPGQNEHSSRSNSSSSMQPRLPCLPFSRCTSIETKKFGLSVDLNDDGAGGN